MEKHRRRPRLLDQAVTVSLTRDQFTGEELEGHGSLEREVFRLVDHPHPAFAELGEDTIVGDGLPDHPFTFRSEWRAERTSAENYRPRNVYSIQNVTVRKL
jgi:hypothetical protein